MAITRCIALAHTSRTTLNNYLFPGCQVIIVPCLCFANFPRTLLLIADGIFSSKQQDQKQQAPPHSVASRNSPMSPTLASQGPLVASPNNASIQRQVSAPGTPIGYGRHHFSPGADSGAGGGQQAPPSPLSQPLKSAPLARKNPIPGTLTASANTNKGFNMFLKQQQRHMEPEEIAAGYTSGEGSRPSTPVIASPSPQVGRATPIQTIQPPSGGRTTPATISTGRTTPLNMPGRKTAAWGGSQPNSPSLTHKPAWGESNPPPKPQVIGRTTPVLIPQSPVTPGKSTIGWTPQQAGKMPPSPRTTMSPSPRTTMPPLPLTTPRSLKTAPQSPIILKSIALLEKKKQPVNEDLITPEPEEAEPAPPKLPVIAPLTLKPRPCTPVTPTIGQMGSSPRPCTPTIGQTGSSPALGRTTPVFGTSSTAPGDRSTPVTGTAIPIITGTATPFLKGLAARLPARYVGPCCNGCRHFCVVVIF